MDVDAGLACFRLPDDEEAMLLFEAVELFENKSDDKDDSAGEGLFELGAVRRGGLAPFR